MGTLILTSCRQCKHPGDHFFLEIGMAEEYQTLEGVITFLRESQRRKITQFLENNQFTETDYGHQLFHCEQCNHLNARLWIRLSSEQGDSFELSFRCSKCRTKLKKMIDIDAIQNIPCEHCGEKALECSTGCWD